MHRPDDLPKVMEMSLAELSVALLGLPRSSGAWFYGHGIKLFLTNKLDELRQHTEQHGDGLGELRALLRLRLAIREDSATSALLNDVEALARSGSLLGGEAAFVLAMAAEQRGDDLAAKTWWQKAYEDLGRCGCARKAAKAFHNAVATESRIHPHKRLIAEYREAILLCERTGETVARANAELNLSREFQLMGALNLALRHASTAVETAAREQIGGLQYYLSLAQRCHILIELRLAKPALVDFEELQCAPFPEARAAVDVLAPLMERESWIPALVTGCAEASASWAERGAKLAAGTSPGADVPFTNMENRLIEELSTGPKDRHELAAVLFGISGDALAKDNRLKQLLHRVRKKSPDLIGLHEHRYFIAERAAVARR